MAEDRQGEIARRQDLAVGEQDSADPTDGAITHAIAEARERMAQSPFQGKGSPLFRTADDRQRNDSYFIKQIFFVLMGHFVVQNLKATLQKMAAHFARMR
ncbi:MAG: hypothetical protein C0485_10480 [Pirellula sp.]|nr:hypothetical protein [Pirellula sp.]